MDAYGPRVLRVMRGRHLHRARRAEAVRHLGRCRPDGHRRLVRQLGLAPAYPLAVAVGLAEFGGGLLLVAGALTFFAAVALILEMLVAIWKVHRANGFFLTGRTPGWITARIQPRADRRTRLACALTGPGAFSFDQHRAASAAADAARPRPRSARQVLLTMTDDFTAGQRSSPEASASARRRRGAGRARHGRRSRRINRSRTEAERAAATFAAAGRRAIICQADLSVAAEAQTLVDKRRRRLGRLDVLINMASVYTVGAVRPDRRGTWNAVARRRPAGDVSLLACRGSAHAPRRAAGASQLHRLGGRQRTAALQGLPSVLRRQARRHRADRSACARAGADGILVNAIAPGPIVAPEDMSAEEAAKVEEATPLGRWGGVQEIAKTVAFLIESDFVTGETIRVDGGRHVR